MDVMEQIADYDNTLLTELKENEQVIEAIKIEIENERAQVMSIMEQSLAKKRQLAQKQAASQKILNDLAQTEKEITQELKKAKEAENAARNEIARLVSGDGSRYVGGKFLWPSTNSYRITSPYSMRVHPTLGVYKQHTGIDIGASYGTNVLAAADGTVIIAGWNNAYGNYVVINHGGGVTTLYGHNSSLTVSKGQKVSRGQVIAKVGSTGYSTGPHIHFEVQVNGSPVNPMSYLQ
ncbi:MAG: peptidoglycan DD-metalloendopeptidase family protein [Clostridia bacterium]|nr:peptidoglycan DD-metalloendopeptidase family protein [Clostridia bacterium]